MKNKLTLSVVAIISILAVVLSGMLACNDVNSNIQKTDVDYFQGLNGEQVDDTEQTDGTEQTDNSKQDDSLPQADSLPQGDSLPQSDSTEQKDDLHQTDTQKSSAEFYIRYLNVGQADAALVCCDGKYMLIDGGGKKSSNLIYSVLKNNNISQLEYIFCSHPHEDHVGGLAGALNAAKAGAVFCSTKSYDSKAFEAFEKYTREQGLEITIPKAHDKYYLGSAVIDVLGPLEEFDSTNNNSIILKITHGKKKFLFMGDAEYEAESSLLEASSPVKCDVIKVGHHGSSTSSSYRLIYMSQPDHAIISVGKNNSYGHPSEEVLSRFSDAQIPVYRTDLYGDITVYSDGEQLSFEFEKQPSNQ